MVPKRHPTTALLIFAASACSSHHSSFLAEGAEHDAGGMPGQVGCAGGGAAAAIAGQGGIGGSLDDGGRTGAAGRSESGFGGIAGLSEVGGRSGAGGAGTAGRGAAGTGMGGAPSTAGAAPAGAGGGGGNALGGASSGGNSGVLSPSAGCTKTHELQNGTVDITFNNTSRKFILRLPDGYDDNHPYRLVLAYAWSGASASDVVSANYFTFATQDGKNTIFAAPDAADGAGTWSNDDVAFTDAILARIEGDLCVDETRVFATGFSFGGAMAMALACTRADVFRAVAFFSGADLTNSCPTTLTKAIAYYASQASEDSNGLSTSSPITGEKRQADFAAVNGCMPEPSSTTFPASGQPHSCTNYKGCSAGHPTEYCVFNGPHGWEPKDPGQMMSWDAPEAWKFITQF